MVQLRNALAGLCMLVLVAPVLAQRGAGAQEGAARGAMPEIVEMEGAVRGASIGRCAVGGRRARLGAHVEVDTLDGRFVHLHLGPLREMEDLLARLPDGAMVNVHAFRTDAMPEDHFVAVEVTAGDETTTLRDEETLRPAWAGTMGARGGGGMRRGGDEWTGRPGRGGGRSRWSERAADGCWWVDPGMDDGEAGDESGAFGEEEEPR